MRAFVDSNIFVYAARDFCRKQTVPKKKKFYRKKCASVVHLNFFSWEAFASCLPTSPACAHRNTLRARVHFVLVGRLSGRLPARGLNFLLNIGTKIFAISNVSRKRSMRGSDAFTAKTRTPTRMPSASCARRGIAEVSGSISMKNAKNIAVVSSTVALVML